MSEDQVANGLAWTAEVKPLCHVSMLHFALALDSSQVPDSPCLEPSWDAAVKEDAEGEPSSPAQIDVFIIKHEY